MFIGKTLYSLRISSERIGELPNELVRNYTTVFATGALIWMQ